MYVISIGEETESREERWIERKRDSENKLQKKGQRCSRSRYDSSHVSRRSLDITRRSADHL